MTPTHRAPQPSATGLWSGPLHRRAARALSWGAAVAAFALVAVFSVVPTMPRTSPAVTGAEQYEKAQSLVAVSTVPAPEVSRDAFEITPGRVTFINSGTNYDWAKLVLDSAGWPITDDNVTVITRWMRQENYIDTWWNRNNPLNNGWGSGGGGGLGSYPSLVVAAENAAEALHTHPGYAEIRAAFARSAPTEVTESAIWASPWASSHYANGTHWHYEPVPVVKAPPGAW
jgi:hypothetical protein